jgi:hypothetical protein
MSAVPDTSFSLRHNLGEEAIFSMMHVPSSAAPAHSPAPPPPRAGAPAARLEYPPFYPAADQPHASAHHAPYPPPAYPPGPWFSCRGEPEPLRGWAASRQGRAEGGYAPPAALTAESLRSVVRSALSEMLHSRGWAEEAAAAFTKPAPASAPTGPALVPAAAAFSSAGLDSANATATADSSPSLLVWGMVLLGASVLLLVVALLVVWRVMRTSAKRRRELPEETVAEVADVFVRRVPKRGADRLAARVWVRQVLSEIRKRQAGRGGGRGKGGRARAAAVSAGVKV